MANSGRPYPIVNLEPSLGSAVKAWGISDYAFIATWSTACYLGGFITSSNDRFIRRSVGIRSGLVGLVGASMMSVLLTGRKILGKAPNEDLIARYGALSEDDLAARIATSGVAHHYMISAPKN